MDISDFDYELPDQLIAQKPLPERDQSRMLVVDRESQQWHDSEFGALPDYLRLNDVLVLNNTRVFPARLVGERIPSGGKVELLLLREIGSNLWSALVRPARRILTGARIRFGKSDLHAEVVETQTNGMRLIKFESDQPLRRIIDEIGRTPLPPYIKRKGEPLEADKQRYQTVYAKERGAIAAPTAGLHFTPRILRQVEARGARVAEITLHVGYGTFEPVRATDVSRHRVASEWFSITDEAAKIINRARQTGGRVIAVGTTTTRALESSVTADGLVESGSGFTEITIVPGFQFRAVDALLTNFHLPRSSLLMLVGAFADRSMILSAYRHAVTDGYRFYSYGDCMLIH